MCYTLSRDRIGPASGDHGKFLLLPPPPSYSRSRNISVTTPPPPESGQLLEIAENFCYYPPPLNRASYSRSRKISASTPPPTESGQLLEITENVYYYPPPPQSVIVPLLDYPLRIRPCLAYVMSIPRLICRHVPHVIPIGPPVW